MENLGSGLEEDYGWAYGKRIIARVGLGSKLEQWQGNGPAFQFLVAQGKGVKATRPK